MRSSPQRRTAGFTLIEVIIGMSLSLMIMAGVLSSYVFLGRSFARSFGITSANGASLESQGRRTLAYLTQDVAMASGLDTTGIAPKVLPSASGVTLILPTGAGARTVTYAYDNVAQTLTRTLEGGSAQILHSSLLNLSFTFYDSNDHPYTSYTNYLSGIKQISLTFSTQAGDPSNGTQTQIYQVASPRLILRNKQGLR